MHISRIRVPNFRALKNIDISFEEDFEPRFFPLASINGGGKSTLLQLVFTILHCSSSKKNLIFVKNILDFVEIPEDGNSIEFLSLEIKDKNEVIDLNFSLIPSTKYSSDLTEWATENEINIPSLDYSVLDFDFKQYVYVPDGDFPNQIDAIHQEIVELKKSIAADVTKLKGRWPATRAYFQSHKGEIDFLKSLPFFSYSEVAEQHTNISQFNNHLQTLVRQYGKMKQNYELQENISKYSALRGECLITSFAKRGFERYLLCCHSIKLKNISTDLKEYIFELSQKVYLYSSNSQLFLFSGRQGMKNLFVHPDKLSQERLSEDKRELLQIENFHVHEYIPVRELLELFENARDLDFKDIIESSERKYGNRYSQLLKELDVLVPDKKIVPDHKLSQIKFQTKNSTKQVLFPEDLSFGELKKLGLYLWMKSKKIEDSIVLIDELEVGLHPDWQYQIVNDLIRDFSSNQYIVATHSYDICEAVTPAHVKELSPEFKLRIES